MSDLDIAYSRLTANAQRYDLWWRYYDGDQPLVYTAKRLEAAFKNINARFVENWCAVVVDSLLERISLKRFVIENNPTAEQRANDLWRETEMTLDDVDTHRAALVCGEAYVLAWREDDEPIEAYYHDPRTCCLYYDPAHPRQKLWGAKWWDDDGPTGKQHITIYYPESIAYYVSTKNSEAIKNASDFVPDESMAPEGVAVNPRGKVPIYHWRRERRIIQSELQNIRSLQDACNKTLSDMMVAAEFGAYKQRYIIGGGDLSGVQAAPDKIMDIPGSDGLGQQVQVGEFSEVNMTQFLETLDRLAQTIGVISRTPRHYFYAQAGTPSGEALIAMEAPLNHKAARYIELFSTSWRNFMAFLLELDGIEVAPSDIAVVFERPETVQPRTQAEIRQINSGAGIPVATSLRWEGKSDNEIDAMRADMQQSQTDSMPNVGAMEAQTARLQAEMDRRAAQQQDGQ